MTFMVKAADLPQDQFLTVDAQDFYIVSIRPADDPALFAGGVDLVRDVTMEIDAGQNVILVNENLPDDPTALLTVAIEKTTGRVIGLLTSTRSPDNIIVWFGSLAIRPDYRGRGLAKKLVQHAVDNRARFDGYVREKGRWFTGHRNRS